MCGKEGEVPKNRPDRQLPWVLAKRKMAVGSLFVLPVFKDSCFIVPERNEGRWPDLHKGVVRGPDNRMGIAAGSLLDKQRVPIGQKSPFWDKLHREGTRQFWRIVIRNGEFRLPIVAVVDGLAVAQRRRVHIYSHYQEDLTDIRSSMAVVQGRLDDPMIRLSGKQQQTLLAAIGQYQLQIEDIAAILADRAAREVGLKLAFETAQTELTEKGSYLKKVASLAEVGRSPRLDRVRRTTDRYIDELVVINSKEIRPLVNPVRLFLKRLSMVEGETIGANLSARFNQVGDRLLEAALQLQLQAQDIDPLEMTTARQLELVGP